MKNQFKSFLAIMLVMVLTITSLPTSASAFEWAFLDWQDTREYSNSYSSGTITYQKKDNNVRLSYSSGKVVEFLNFEMVNQDYAMTDGFGTAYFYKEISTTAIDGRFLQIYYYNKDINKNSNVEPLLNENGNYVYARAAYFWDYNTNGSITIQRIVTDDGDRNGTFTPSFELMKQQYDSAHPNMTPEPDNPTQAPVITNTPVPVVTNTPTQAPGTNTSTPSFEPSIQPSKKPAPTQSSGGIDTIIVVYPSKKPQETQTPGVSQVPQTPKVSQEPKTSKIDVTKSDKSVEATQDGEVIAKVTFNKKTGVANFKLSQKNKKVKKVKQAFIIGDSYNYGYITKSNKFKTINRKTGKVKTYSGKWKKATIKKNVAVKIVKLKGSKKKTITGF